MKFRRDISWPAALAVAALLCVATLPACSGNPKIQTGVSTVADISNAGGKIEQSANTVLKATQSLNAQTNPATKQPLVSQAVLDQVAMIVYRVGKLGLDLNTELSNYNAIKAAGKDITAAATAVQKTVGDLIQAFADIGKQIPDGTAKVIDEAVATAFSVIAQVKGLVALQ
jgi:hypothetical protein